MPPSAQTTKLQSTLRLLVPRLRLLQKKDTASSVSQRRELAQLLENGREASARYRVENVIATDIGVEVMEIIELYCELLLARTAVLDQIAFSDKGVEARNRAKEELRLSVEKKGGSSASIATATTTEQKQKGGGLGWFSSGRTSSTSTSTPTTSYQHDQDKNPEPTAPLDENDDFDEEANSYISAGLDEAAASIFYACPRFPREVKELTQLRLLLMERWGKDFATLAQDNKVAIKIPERLVKKLRVKPPSTELVESYLREIAKAYNVAWPADEVAEGDVPEPISAEEREQTTSASQPDDDKKLDTSAPPHTPRKNLDSVHRSETDELSRATPPRDIGSHDTTGKSPISVAKPGPSSDNPEPRVRIPGDTEADQKKNASNRPGGGLQRKDSKGIPDVDELSKRFAALKR